MVCEFEPCTWLVLTAQSLEPASDSMFLSLSLSLSLPLLNLCVPRCLSVSLSKISKHLTFSLKNEDFTFKTSRFPASVIPGHSPPGAAVAAGCKEGSPAPTPWILFPSPPCLATK